MKVLKYLNRLIPFSIEKSNLSNIENVLVVSNTGFGDTLLSTPAIKTLRDNKPNIKLTFMVNINFYNLFKDLEFVDNVIVYKKGLLNQIKTIKKLKSLNIDTIFLLHSNGPEDIFFSKLSGAKNILKMTHNKNHEFKTIFLNESVLKEQHDIESRLDLIRLFDIKDVTTSMFVPQKFYNTRKYFDNSFNYIAFQLGAQDSFKMWPVENFVKLADKILSEYINTKIIILGATKYEEVLTKKFLDLVEDKSRVIDLCSKTKVEELPLILNNSKCLVTNDTGTMHLNIALKNSTICLFGPTNSKLFGPYQDLELHNVIQKNINIDSNSFNKKKWTQDTMSQISVNEVYNLLKVKLGSNND